jgi:membrane protein DedA with SNARE-associated domain
MLLAGLGWLLYTGWDIRAGNKFMQVILAVDVVIALVLMIWGFQKKKRQIN